ncbi:hypothetical protein GCM10009796_23460 [Microbacterium koreense]
MRHGLLRACTSAAAAVAIGITLSIAAVPPATAAEKDQDEGFSDLRYGPSDPDALTTIEGGSSEATLSTEPPAKGDVATTMRLK